MVQTIYPQQGGTLADFMSKGLESGFQSGLKMFGQAQENAVAQQKAQTNAQYMQGLQNIQQQKQKLDAFQTARDMADATLSGAYGDMSPAEVEMIFKTGLQGTGLPPEAIDAYGKIARGNSEFARNFRQQIRDTFDDPTMAAQFDAATKMGGVPGGMKFLGDAHKRSQEEQKAQLDQQYREAQIAHEQAQTYRTYNPPARAAGGGGGGGGARRAATPSYLKTTLWDENGNETEGFIDRGTGVVHVIENGRLVPMNQAGGQAPEPQPQAMPQAPRALPQVPGPGPQAPAGAPPMPARQGGGATGSWGEEPQAPAPQGTPVQQGGYTTTKPRGTGTGTVEERKAAGQLTTAERAKERAENWMERHPDYLENSGLDQALREGVGGVLGGVVGGAVAGVGGGVIGGAVGNVPGAVAGATGGASAGAAAGAYAGKQLDPLLKRLFQSDQGKEFEAAWAPFINANLRRETGAVITADEWREAFQRFIPMPGDSVETRALKAANRSDAIDAMRAGAGAAARNIPQAQPYVPPSAAPQAQPRAPQVPLWDQPIVEPRRRR